MSKRRIEALQTLRRLEERQLDELARDLTQVQTAQAKALAQVDHLQERAIKEASTTAYEAMPYVGKFLANLRKEQTRANETAHQLQVHIDTLRSEVMVHFSAERAYDRLAATALSALREERRRKEESAIEDLTLSRFGRA